MTRCILVEFQNLSPKLRNRIGRKKQFAKLRSAISAVFRLRTASRAKFTADLVCELRKQCGGGDDGAVGDHDAIADGLEVVAPSGVMLCLLRCTVVLEAVVFNDELFVGPEQIWVKIALGNEVSIAGLGHDRSVGNGLRKTVASKLAGQAEKQIENGLIGGTQVVDGKVDGPERL